MLAYILLLSALFGVRGALANPCVVGEASILTGKIKELNMRCPCNETSGLNIDHKQNECNCFRIPTMSQNCNLSCFQDGINVYNGEGNKGEIDKLTSNITKFFKRSFQSHVKFCNNIPCVHPCDEMKKVNAIKFWERLQGTYQNINSQKKITTKLNKV